MKKLSKTGKSNNYWKIRLFSMPGTATLLSKYGNADWGSSTLQYTSCVCPAHEPHILEERKWNVFIEEGFPYLPMTHFKTWTMSWWMNLYSKKLFSKSSSYLHPPLRPWNLWTANSDKKYTELNGAALNVNKPRVTSPKTAFLKDK